MAVWVAAAVPTLLLLLRRVVVVVGMVGMEACRTRRARVGFLYVFLYSCTTRLFQFIKRRERSGGRDGVNAKIADLFLSILLERCYLLATFSREKSACCTLSQRLRCNTLLLHPITNFHPTFYAHAPMLMEMSADALELVRHRFLLPRPFLARPLQRRVRRLLHRRYPACHLARDGPACSARV